ncbi:MAG TPA: hypothetical protein VHO70_16755, partial [Chitinispirillaceae bacterium]|nr:hypothetical protein [Chitinispirillaceae bacterium]
KDGKDDYDLYPPSLTFPEETSTVKLDIWPKSEPSAGQSPSSAKADDRNDNSPQKTTRRIHVHGYARPSYHFLCDIGWIKGERSLSKTHAHAFSAAAVVDEIMSWCREGQLTLSKTKHAIWLLDKGWQHIDTQFSDFYQRKDRSDDKQNSQQLEEERQTEIATLQQQMRELQQLTFQQETNPATIEPILQRAFETIKSSLAALKQGVELVQHIQEEISQTDEPSPMVSVVPPLPHSKGSSTEDAAVYASPAPEKRAKSCVREIREGGKTPTDLYNHLSHEIQNAILELQRLRNLDSTQQTDFSAKHQLIVGLLNKSRRLLQKHDHLLQSSAPEETKVPDTAPPDMRVLQFLPLDIDQYASFSCRPTYQTAPYICSLINSLDQLNERAILLLATPDHPIRDFLPAYKTLCEQLKNENPKFTFHTPATSRKETPHHGRASSAETPDAPTFRGASAGCS